MVGGKRAEPRDPNCLFPYSLFATRYSLSSQSVHRRVSPCRTDQRPSLVRVGANELALLGDVEGFSVGEGIGDDTRAGCRKAVLGEQLVTDAGEREGELAVPDAAIGS